MTAASDPLLWAEHAVIASVVRDPSKLHEIDLTAKDFTVRDHRVLWECILQLDAEGEPIDIISVAERADAAGCIGVLVYLTGLLDNAIECGLDNYRYYARMIWSAGRSGDLWKRVRKAFEERSEAELVHIADAIQSDSMPGARTTVQSDLSSAWQQHVDLVDEMKAAPPHKWGLSALDRDLGRLMPGRLYVVMARPGLGKTAFAMNIALANATEGTPVGVISLEQGKAELAARAVCILSGCALKQVTGEDDRSGIDERRINEAKQRLPDIPIVINDGAPMDIARVRGVARKLVERNGAAILLVDYLQTIRTNARRERHEEVADNVQELKSLAKQLQVPLIVLAQAKRDAEGKRPTMSDLKDSSVIEAEADVILALHRDLSPESETRNVCEILVLKNRHGESSLLANVSWQGWCFRFADLTRAAP